MRYVVLGAGAVGGVIGGRLAEAGRDVVLVARGPHLDALRARGLDLRDPDRTVLLRPAVAGAVEEVAWREGDVAVLTAKTQDAAGLLRGLSAVAPDTPVVCATNGVESERLAARLCRDVYAVCVMLPAVHLEPGVVEASSAPVSGILDLGCYPRGLNGTARAIAADLRAAGFACEPREAIMPWKYAKLRGNVTNALGAVCGPEAYASDLAARARAEADACFAAAGIDAPSEAEDLERRGDLLCVRPVAGAERPGGSTWQSLARGTGSVESDYLNGEVVLLGRLHGVPTPVNAVLQRLAADLARRRAAPGSVPLAEVEALVAAQERRA